MRPSCCLGLAWHSGHHSGACHCLRCAQLDAHSPPRRNSSPPAGHQSFSEAQVAASNCSKSCSKRAQRGAKTRLKGGQNKLKIGAKISRKEKEKQAQKGPKMSRKTGETSSKVASCNDAATRRPIGIVQATYLPVLKPKFLPNEPGPSPEVASLHELLKYSPTTVSLCIFPCWLHAAKRAHSSCAPSNCSSGGPVAASRAGNWPTRLGGFVNLWICGFVDL